MVSEIAGKFAAVSLDLYGSEREFDIGVSSAEEIESFAAAFEKRGCEVDRDPIRLRLRIRCPETEAKL